MEFEYYTDQIELNNENINNDVEVLPLDNFINSSVNYLYEIGVNPKHSTVFYKHNRNGASVLGIQLMDGDNEDLSNYLVYDCKPFISGKSVFCDIDMHADAKTAPKAIQFARLASNDVTDFFNLMEQSVIKYNLGDLEYMKNMIVSKKKNNVFARILKRF